METTAALIQFPEASVLAIMGIVLIFGSLIFGLFGNDYFKKSKQEKAITRMNLKAIEDIYKDKKLTDSEITLMKSILDHYTRDNPLKSVTTRAAFGDCMHSKMHDMATEGNSENFRTLGIQLRDIRVALGLDYSPIGKPIYSSRELHVGQVISVTLASEHKQNWIRMVLKGIDEAYLYVSKQSAIGNGDFNDGDRVHVKLWHDEDAQYCFQSSVVLHGESNAEWWLGHNEEKLERTQAREHFRMHYEQTVSVGILNSSQNEEPEFLRRQQPVTKLRGKITSLSAGGCALVLQQPIARHVFLRIDLDLPDHAPIPLEAKIIATSNISRGRSLIRTRFIASTQAERDIISVFLRKQQQKTLITETT